MIIIFDEKRISLTILKNLSIQLLNVDTDSVTITHFGDDMRCTIVLASKQVGYFEGICLSPSRSVVICSTENNGLLKHFFHQLNDQQDHKFENCIIYCRQSPARVTLSFEIEELDIDEL